MSRSRFVVSLMTGAALATATVSPSMAGGFYTGSVPAATTGGGSTFGGYGGGGGGGGCHGGGGGGGSTIVINKNININKNLNLNKNININKVVVINKINVQAAAFAQALATANASAGAGAQVIVYGGGSYEFVNVNNSGAIGSVAVEAGGHCEMQEASVVKSIHAVCVSAEGREFPASHMLAETWVDASYEGEVARCIAGSHLKVTIGDVVQSDQGLAGTYSSGVILQCGEHEAVRHFKDGMLKCAPAMAVPDCTERTNLRKWGTGDLFFTYRSKVCAETARAVSHDVELDANSMGGGVGGSGSY
ncbi:MAG TPA: hypothetical protein VMF58_05770 [Rhizomicrobium sp.]|nr:hypothetical protein [Rhizomicrobium sp.]